MKGIVGTTMCDCNYAGKSGPEAQAEGGTKGHRATVTPDAAFLGGGMNIANYNNNLPDNSSRCPMQPAYPCQCNRCPHCGGYLAYKYPVSPTITWGTGSGNNIVNTWDANTNAGAVWSGGKDYRS